MGAIILIMFYDTENPYDADDEDSSSESESHVEHISVAADYFAPKVDKVSIPTHLYIIAL